MLMLIQPVYLPSRAFLRWLLLPHVIEVFHYHFLEYLRKSGLFFALVVECGRIQRPFIKMDHQRNLFKRLFAVPPRTQYVAQKGPLPLACICFPNGEQKGPSTRIKTSTQILFLVPLIIKHLSKCPFKVPPRT